MDEDAYLVHRHHCTSVPGDTLDVWKPVNPQGDPSIQINQTDGDSAFVTYAADQALALAEAILEAAGLSDTYRIRNEHG